MREYDISNIVCPIVTAEKLAGLRIANSSNVRFEPNAGFPPGSRSWHFKGDLVDAMTVSTLGVWLGPGDRCEAQFRHTL